MKALKIFGLVLLFALTLFLNACNAPATQPSAVAQVAASNTSIPTLVSPTDAPTATPAPPTATDVPPTNTPTKIPPTNTPLPTSTHTATFTPTLPPTATRTATATTNPRATAAAQAAKLLQSSSSWLQLLRDGFGKYECYGWLTGPRETESAQIDQSCANDKYLWDIKAKSDATGAGALAALFGTLTDYTVSVDARQTSGTPNSRYGVIFRADAPKFFVFDIADDQSYRFLKESGGSPLTPLLVGKSSAIKPHVVNQITVIAQGSRFTFFVNNQYVAQADEPSLKEGDAGLIVELAKAGDAATFEFDNFEVRSGK